MMNSEILSSIKTLIVPILQEGDFRLIDLNLHPQGKRLILRLLIDRSLGGITLDECARLNDEIGEAIDKQGIINQNYILEVSSPGLDRPLMTRDDFSRCLNRKIRIFFNQYQEGGSEVAGVIISVSDFGVNIDSEGQVQQIPFDRIRRAKQIIEEVR